MEPTAETKSLVQGMLQRAGIGADDDLLEQLVPMVLRWQDYIQQARSIEVGVDQEPAGTLF